MILKQHRMILLLAGISFVNQNIVSAPTKVAYSNFNYGQALLNKINQEKDANKKNIYRSVYTKLMELTKRNIDGRDLLKNSNLLNELENYLDGMLV